MHVSIKNNINPTQEMFEKAVDKITKAYINQLDRIEGEVNFIKQDMRELKILLNNLLLKK